MRARVPAAFSELVFLAKRTYAATQPAIALAIVLCCEYRFAETKENPFRETLAGTRSLHTICVRELDYVVSTHSRAQGFFARGWSAESPAVLSAVRPSRLYSTPKTSRHAREFLQFALPTAPKSHKMNRIIGRRVVMNQIFERGLELNFRAWSFS